MSFKTDTSPAGRGVDRGQAAAVGRVEGDRRTAVPARADQIHQAFLTLDCALFCFNHLPHVDGDARRSSLAFAATFNVTVVHSMIGIWVYNAAPPGAASPLS